MSTFRGSGHNVGTPNGIPLLYTCGEPMFAGPLKKLTYVYATANNPNGTPPVYGQILSEKSTTANVALTTLTMNTAATRTETRYDGATRTFTYDTAKGLLTSATDFKGVAATRSYDTNRFCDAITNRRNQTTDFTNNPLTGATVEVQYPAVTSATPAPAPRGITSTTYGWPSCPDVNNRDASRPYYPHKVTDEGGNAIIYTRDSNKRLTRIDYPDEGYETFTYDTYGFGLVATHRLKTGGTESFTYNASGQMLTYRSPDNPEPGNPTARYAYDTLGRLSAVCDVLGNDVNDTAHTTNFEYNTRGQLTTTTLPIDPVDGMRHTIVDVYNPDGTLASNQDQRGKITDGIDKR